VRYCKAPTRHQYREGCSQGVSEDVLSFCLVLESNPMVSRPSTTVAATTKDMVEGR
jgi:hypothetical protein